MRINIGVFRILPNILTLAACFCTAASASPALVGLWRFDEADGDTALDSSGLGNDGTLAGDTPDSKPARVPGQTGFGSALQFFNNWYDHCLVSIPASPTLRIGVTADDTWTIAFWANETSDGYGNFLATYGRPFAFDGGLGLNFDSGANGDAQFYIWHDSQTAWQQGFGTDAAVVPVLDQWVHLALVYDGQSLTLYRNGNQGTLGAKSSLTVHSSVAFAGYSGSLQIGTMPNMDGSRNWWGLIDDFAVFNGALTETQVRTITTGDFSDYLAGPPKIATEPQDKMVNQGLEATLSVVATSDTPMTYQWQFDGTDLPGATETSLTLPNVQTSQGGSYSVTVRNATGSVASRAAMLTVLTPLPPCLAGLWRFDEGQGDVAHDSSGLTNNGTLVGVSWVPGQTGFGQALHFQNNSYDHFYVEIPANESLMIGQTANDTWSICLWAKELSDGYGNYVATYGRLFAFDGGFGLNFNSGAPGDSQFWIWHNSQTAWQQGFGTDAAVVPILHEWVHLALVYDGRTLTLYRSGNQGVLGGTTTLTVNSPVGFNGYSGSLQIGTMPNMDGTRNWNGLLDDVAVFTGALSEDQVRTVMSGDFSAFLNLKPSLALTRSGSQLVVTWGFGMLQSATDVNGLWEDQPEARSPLVVTPGDEHRFFRVRRDLSGN